MGISAATATAAVALAGLGLVLALAACYYCCCGRRRADLGDWDLEDAPVRPAARGCAPSFCAGGTHLRFFFCCRCLRCCPCRRSSSCCGDRSGPRENSRPSSAEFELGNLSEADADAADAGDKRARGRSVECASAMSDEQLASEQVHIDALDGPDLDDLALAARAELEPLPRLSGPAFEAAWQNSGEVEVWGASLHGDAPSETALIDLFRRGNVHCLASGQVAGVRKFYLYGQAHGGLSDVTSGLTMAEVSMVLATGRVSCVFKGSSPAAMHFTAFAKAVIDNLHVSSPSAEA